MSDDFFQFTTIYYVFVSRYWLKYLMISITSGCDNYYRTSL